MRHVMSHINAIVKYSGAKAASLDLDIGNFEQSARFRTRDAGAYIVTPVVSSMTRA